jgi:Acetyltransferase (GNAT) domain
MVYPEEAEMRRFRAAKALEILFPHLVKGHYDPLMSRPAALTAVTMQHEDRSASMSGVGRWIRVVRDAAGLASIREPWLRMQGDRISSDPDFFLASAEADPTIVRPHVVVLERGGVAEAMLVGRVERLRLPSRLGYRTVYAPEVRSLTVVYGGILGDLEDFSFRTLLASVRSSLADREADLAIFRYLPVDSSFYQIASREPSPLLRQRGGEPETHWELDLPDRLDALLRSRSKATRQSATRTMRRLERTYGDRLEVRRYTSLEELDEFFRAVETIAPKTYQSGLGVGFRDTPSHRGRVRALMELGRYRGWVLTLDGNPLAFEHGALYRGRFRSGRPGYDPAYAHLSIGTYLFLRTLEELCVDRSARVVDHGTGDADYKRRFGTRSWQEANAVVYAPTLRGIRINAVRSAFEVGIGTAKRVVGEGELARSLKRQWRDRLSRPG